jgi:hypothetical protein
VGYIESERERYFFLLRSSSAQLCHTAPLPVVMLFLNTAITALITAASAAPLVHRNQARQNVITASERLGLQWLGGNSSLPKIL